MYKWVTITKKNLEKDETRNRGNASTSGSGTDTLETTKQNSTIISHLDIIESTTIPTESTPKICDIISIDNPNDDSGDPKPKIAKLTPSSASTSVIKKRGYRFQKEWLDDPEFKDWLTKSKSIHGCHIAGKQEMAYCKVCETNIFPHKTDVLRHKKSEKHKSNFQQVKNTNDIQIMLMPCDGVKNAELKLCGLLATNNLPFSLMDTLSSLCANIFPDSKIAKKMSIKRTKATVIMRQALGHNFKEQLYGLLRNEGSFFSLIMDETTDVGAVKQCAFSIIYFCNETNKVTTSFFDMVETPHGDAANLYETLKKCLKDKKIPSCNLVAFSSDTTNVMVGKLNSVFSHLKNDLPEIVCVKCSCHMVHLAASKACMQLPRSVEDMLRNIGSHFSRSYSRQQKLKEFQEFFKTDIHKILLPSITRWLSVQQCTNRVLEQYEPLRAYFRETNFEDPSKTNDDILKCLDNTFIKIYLEFMSYILDILNDFNTQFQGEVPLLHRLKPEIIRILNILYSNYMKKQSFSNVDAFSLDHKNPRHFVPIEQIYIGIAAHESIQNLKSDVCCNNSDIELFLTTCLKFYIELISELKSRFVFDDPIYDLVKVVDPVIAQSYETKTLLPIVQRFSFLRNFISPQTLDNEWKKHSLLNHIELGLDSNLTPEVYWSKVFKLTNAANIPLFSTLNIVIKLLLILPFSNASVERIFSKLNLIKTDNRNKLNTETITALLFTKEGIERQGGCVKFTPSKAMLAAKHVS